MTPTCVVSKGFDVSSFGNTSAGFCIAQPEQRGKCLSRNGLLFGFGVAELKKARQPGVIGARLALTKSHTGGATMAKTKANTDRATIPITTDATGGISEETAEELTDAVIEYLQNELLPKYGLDDTDIFPAMEAILRKWNEGAVVLLDLGQDMATLTRLEAWSERKGCSVEEAAHKVLAQCAPAVLPTAEEDAELEAELAEYEQSGAKESVPPLPEPKKPDWDVN
jgi:hypothetical protein